ncbi:MAG: selenide, water dikinase SelD [Planctomycetota bacterium]|nr:selenide, water dikinase SelD [Planctomycetota bacterium]
MPQEGTAQVVRGLPKFNDPDLLVGAEDFSDAGVYRLRDDLLILQSLDFFPPLVDDPFLFGQIAAANSLSDIYAMGGTPRTALNIVGFPDDKLDLSILGDILAGGADRVVAAGAVIAGGHTVRDTEIKYGLSVTGVATPQELLTNGGARPGDALVLSKPLGTGFVTTAFKKNRCPADVLAVAAESMAMLNQGASQSAKSVSASASTDITGFGLAGHAGEMAQSSDVTLTIRTSELPVLPGAAELAASGNHTRASKTNRSAVDPLMRIETSADDMGLEMVFDAQTSGGLLMSVDPGRADELVRLCRKSGAESTAVVGSVQEKSDTFLVFTG